MYEALLKATPEYQKVAASFGSAGPAALFGLPPAGRALLYAALQKDLGRVLCIVTPGEAEATHFADDLKALGLTAAVFPPRDFMLRPVEGAGREYEYRRLSVLGALAGGRLQAVCVPTEALLQYTVPRAEFIQNTLTLKPGMVYNREALVARLFAAGYVRRSQVDGPGQSTPSSNRPVSSSPRRNSVAFCASRMPPTSSRMNSGASRWSSRVAGCG